jgi:thiol-disulfide isomerase/thioredoxin
MRAMRHGAVGLVLAVGFAATLASALAGCGKPKVAEKAPEPKTESAIEIQPATLERVQQAIRAPGARATLVNVWASWCAPCREEFPDLMRIRHEYRERGLRLVLVSADVDSGLPEAKRFLEAQGVGFLTYLKQGADMPFIDGLDSLWSGALPATVLYDGTGRKLWFHEGKTSYDSLKSRVEAVLATKSTTTP